MIVLFYFIIPINSGTVFIREDERFKFIDYTHLNYFFFVH